MAFGIGLLAQDILQHKVTDMSSCKFKPGDKVKVNVNKSGYTYSSTSKLCKNEVYTVKEYNTHPLSAPYVRINLVENDNDGIGWNEDRFELVKDECKPVDLWKDMHTVFDNTQRTSQIIAQHLSMSQTLQVQQSQVQDMYKCATPEVKSALEKLFPEMVDKSIVMDLTFELKSKDGKILGWTRTNVSSKHYHTSIVLNTSYNWEIKTDADGEKILVPTKR